MHALQFNSMRHKMMIAFAVLTAIIVFITAISYYYLMRVEQVTSLFNRVNQLENASLQLMKMDVDLLTTESRNETWYSSDSLPALITRNSYYHRLAQQVSALCLQANSAGWYTDASFKRLELGLKSYDQLFQEIKQKQLLRGFKDYGVEGIMRSHAHALESARQGGLSLSEVLSLRRHEKDYFLRKDDAYRQQLNLLSESYQEQLAHKYGASAARSPIRLLQEYTAAFNLIVLLEQEIGQESGTGLRGELLATSNRLTKDFETITEASQLWAEENLLTLKLNFGLTGLMCVLVGLLLSYFLSNRFARPLQRLSHQMDKFLLEISTPDAEVNMSRSSHEIQSLAKSYLRMTRQLRQQYKEIKEKGKVLEAQNAELKKLNFEIDQFVYSAAHDFRAPITSLIGLINLLRMESHTGQFDQYFEMMEGSIKKVDFFIQDILNYSSNKSMAPEIESVDLKEMVTAIYATNRFSIESQNIALTYHILDKERRFFSDKKRLMIVLNNLLSNSIRYFDPNKQHPHIHLQVLINEQEVSFEISDNGIGIPDGDQRKIFQMFYRASALSTGSGLGLFIVRETIRKLGGEITVSSTVGEGSTFRFVLPNHQEHLLNVVEPSTEIQLAIGA
ncbi:MAG: sensor histidine kinase [Salibacteraceae bacterium]